MKPETLFKLSIAALGCYGVALIVYGAMGMIDVLTYALK